MKLKDVLLAAVVKSEKGPANGSLFTEEDWNDESSLNDQPYRFSKVLVPCCVCASYRRS